MPPTAEIEDEPLSLAQHAKRKFQPDPPAREVRQQEEPPAPTPEPKKEPEAAKPAPTKEEAPQKPAPNNEPAASEDDAVFGRDATKPAKAEKPDKGTPAKDEAFEKQLAEETTGMTSKAQEKWVKLRQSEKAAAEKATKAEEEINQLREQIKTAAETRQEVKGEDLTPKVESLTAENESLKAQLADAEKALSVTQVERSKRYRTAVTEPMGELTKQVEDIAGRYEVSAKDILKVLDTDPKERTKALSDLAADMQEPDRVELYEIARGMDRLRRAGEKLREKAKEDLSVLEEEERAMEERAVKERRQALSASAARAWDEAASAHNFLNANPAAPEWTEALANARAQSENWIPGQDAVADGRIRAQAAQHPFLVKAIAHKEKTIAALKAERDQLLERIKADNDTDPDLSGGREVEDVHSEDEGEGMTIGQRVAKKVGAK